MHNIRTVVADGWRTSHLISIGLIMQMYDVERLENPDDSRLKTSLLMSARASN